MLSMGYGFAEYKRKADADKAIKLLQVKQLFCIKLILRIVKMFKNILLSEKKDARQEGGKALFEENLAFKVMFMRLIFSLDKMNKSVILRLTRIIVCNETND